MSGERKQERNKPHSKGHTCILIKHIDFFESLSTTSVHLADRSTQPKWSLGPARGYKTDPRNTTTLALLSHLTTTPFHLVHLAHACRSSPTQPHIDNLYSSPTSPPHINKQPLSRSSPPKTTTTNLSIPHPLQPQTQWPPPGKASSRVCAPPNLLFTKPNLKLTFPPRHLPRLQHRRPSLPNRLRPTRYLPLPPHPIYPSLLT